MKLNNLIKNLESQGITISFKNGNIIIEALPEKLIEYEAAILKNLNSDLKKILEIKSLITLSPKNDDEDYRQLIHNYTEEVIDDWLYNLPVLLGCSKRIGKH